MAFPPDYPRTEGKPLPRPRPLPWHRYLRYIAWSYLTWWPWQTRHLKREGFIRTGWMTWGKREGR